MRLIDADAFKKQIAEAAIRNGTTDADSKAGAMEDIEVRMKSNEDDLNAV